MSGVYIQNMKIPTDGATIFAIRADGMVEDVMGCYVGKAVPVPPHGRLIDADELDAYLKTAASMEDGEAKEAYIDARAEARTMPVIIPADPAEEGE